MAKIFVSYTAADREMAEWIGGVLQENGHVPFLHNWQVAAGQNLARWMDERMGEAAHLLGVFSDAYAQGIYSNYERWAAYWQDPEGRDGFLWPVEVAPVTKWPPSVRPLRRVSLVGLNEAAAERALVDFLRPPAPPTTRPRFPGAGGAALEGQGNLARSEEGPSIPSKGGDPLPVNGGASPEVVAKAASGGGGDKSPPPVPSAADDVPDPSDASAFSKWLETKPKEWSVAIAVRAALRVLPQLSGGSGVAGEHAGLVLSSVRALAVARVAAGSPASTARLYRAALTAFQHAADSAATAADTARANTVTDLAFTDAAVSAAFAVRTATRSHAAANAGVASDPTVQAVARALTGARDDASVRSYFSPAADSSRAIDAALKAFTRPAHNAAAVRRYFSAADLQWLARNGRSPEDLIRQPLWLRDEDLPPAALIRAWGKLRADLLRSDELWRVWTDWYDEVLAGSPPSPSRSEAWQIAFTDIDEPLPWNEGPKAVNRAIKARLDALMPPADVSVPPLPEQAIGPHYRANEDGRIDRAPAADMDAEGNDLRTVEQLRPLVLRCAANLRSLLPINQFPQLIQEIERYEAALQPGDGRAAEWGVVWGQGVILQSAAAAAERQIADRMLPEMEDPAKTALASLLTLHGPLILATTVGARMTEQATHFAMSAQQQAELRRAAEVVVAQLEATPDLITPEALGIAEPAVQHMGEGPRPERTSLYGLVNIKNISIVLLGGAAVATPALLGLLLGGPVGAIVGTPFSFLAAETIKKNPTFLALVQQLNLPLEKVLDGKVWERQIRKFSPFREFVIRNQEPLRNIARTTPELNWMQRYIDFITTDHGSPGGE